MQSGSFQAILVTLTVSKHSRGRESTGDQVWVKKETSLLESKQFICRRSYKAGIRQAKIHKPCQEKQG